MIVLPRQARDKHRKNSKKLRFSYSVQALPTKIQRNIQPGAKLHQVHQAVAGTTSTGSAAAGSAWRDAVHSIRYHKTPL